MEWSRPELWSRWKERWQRYKYSLLVVLAGAILLLLPSGDTQPKQQETQWSGSGFDLRATEEKLERVLSQVSGAGRVSVVLTLKEGEYRIPARDTRQTDAERDDRTVVLSSGDGGEDVVFLQHIYPKYQGALVVCDGGDDPRVKLELLEAVRALTGLSAEKISVCKRQ